MLGVWKEEHDNPTSTEGTQTSPIVIYADASGGVFEVPLWLRHRYLSGVLGESSYGIMLSAEDAGGTDESSWIEFAEDSGGVAGTYDTEIIVGDVLVGEIVPFWMKIDVPAGGDVGVREDLSIRMDVTGEFADEQLINITRGRFINCEYNAETERIDFDVSGGNSYWESEWVDSSDWDFFNSVTVEKFGNGGYGYVSYRTSSDGTEDTATAWVTDPNIVSTAQFYQFRVDASPSELNALPTLGRNIYQSLDDSLLKSAVQSGSIPSVLDARFGVVGGAPYRTQWHGSFIAEESGNYTFELQHGQYPNRGMRMYLDGELFCDSFQESDEETEPVYTQVTIYLDEGTHPISVEFINQWSTDHEVRLLVDTPTGGQRNVVNADFVPTDMSFSIGNVVSHIRRTGVVRNFDIVIYDGPDVPELISPIDGAQTRLFDPELTVLTQNCEWVNFQFDSTQFFDSSELSDWEVEVVENGTELITAVPDALTRPDGVFYWRARGKKDGEYSEWSDHRVLTILPLVSNDCFLYVTANIGFEDIDEQDQDRRLYFGVNVGFESHDSIDDDRYLYLNANPSDVVGEVIYPIYDDTLTRDAELPGDDDAYGA